MRTSSVLIAALAAVTIAVPAMPGAQALPSSGTIRGRVLDDRGRPLVACRVAIGTLVVSDADARLIALPLSLRTDATGAFEAIGVPPGDWYVRIEQDLLPGSMTADTPDYPVTYFPNVTDPRRAQPVRVAAGAAPVTVDMVVTGIPVFELTLRLAPLDALKAANLELFLNGTEAGRPRAIAPRDVEPDGSVRFRRLRPGRYFVWARTRDRDPVLAAWRRIDVTDRAQTLDFPLTPAGRITGRVTGADARVISGARVVASLVDEGQEIDFREPDSVEMDGDGRFTIGGLFAHRRLKVIGLPEGWRVAAIRLGGRDAAEEILVPDGAALEGVEIALTR